MTPRSLPPPDEEGPVTQHLDVVRNDWDNEVQERVAWVLIGAPDEIDSHGYIVKSEFPGRWEDVIRDVLRSFAEADGSTIASRLTVAFANPYLVAIGPHPEAECPF